MSNIIKKKILQLTTYLNELNYIYYNLGTSKVSDKEYDQLLKTLITLETKYPEYRCNNTPTNKVGCKPISGHVSKHDNEMYSLSNVFSREELVIWIASLNLSDDEIIYGDLKLDGVALRLTYENGELIEAALRGDGSKGDVVTEHAMRIHNIPKVSDNLLRYEVYGEVVLLTSTFEYLNRLRKKESKAPYTTPRNAIAGLMRTKILPLLVDAVFLAYGSDLPGYAKHSDMLGDLVGRYEFMIPETIAVPVKSIESIFKLYDTYNSGKYKKLHWPFSESPADGLVVKVDDIQKQEALGHTAKAPRWAVAWKFTDHTKQTVIKNIILQIGRTGVITPIAILDPVVIDGVTILKAQLFNTDTIIEKQFMVGNLVEVVRSGGVIPKIVKCICTTTETKPYKPITNCPECGQPIVKKSSRMQYCINRSCPGILKARLLYAVNRSNLDIKGLGKEKIEKLVDDGTLKDIGDLFSLTSGTLLTKFGIPESLNISAQIVNLKNNMTLKQVISAVGIPGLREKDIDSIAKHIITAFKPNCLYDAVQEFIKIGSDICYLMTTDISTASIDGIVEYMLHTKGEELKKIFSDHVPEK